MNENHLQNQKTYKEKSRGTVPRDTLSHISIRLTLDQIHFLKTIQNRSQWIRDAINEKRFTEKNEDHPNSKIILLSKQISSLQTEIVRLETSEDYDHAKSIINHHQETQATNKEEESKYAIIYKLHDFFHQLPNINEKGLMIETETKKMDLAVFNEDTYKTEKSITITKDENEEAYKILSKKLENIRILHGENILSTFKHIINLLQEKNTPINQENKVNNKDINSAKKICAAYENKIRELEEKIAQCKVEIKQTKL